MKSMGKRMIAILLCIVMCVSFLPTAALAEEGTITATEEEEQLGTNVVEEELTPDNSSNAINIEETGVIEAEADDYETATESAIENGSGYIIKSDASVLNTDKSPNNDYELTDNYAENTINIAKAQRGKNASDFGWTDNWCAYFVAWAGRNAGAIFPKPGSGWSASGCDLAAWFISKEAGTFYCFREENKKSLKNNYPNIDFETDRCVELSQEAFAEIDEPRRGDIVCYLKRNETHNNWTHVGLVESYDNGILNTVEGNTSADDSAPYNGNVVEYKHRFFFDDADPESYFIVVGIIRPDYIRPAVSDAVITNVRENGFTLSFVATDNIRIDSVSMTIWNDSDSEDKGVTFSESGTKDNISCAVSYKDDTATFDVAFSSFSNPIRDYHIKWYARDAAGYQNGYSRGERVVSLYAVNVDDSGGYKIIDETANVYSAPSANGIYSNVVKTLKKGQTVSVIGSYFNQYGDKWYQIDEGEWISANAVKYRLVYNFWQDILEWFRGTIISMIDDQPVVYEVTIRANTADLLAAGVDKSDGSYAIIEGDPFSETVTSEGEIIPETYSYATVTFDSNGGSSATKTRKYILNSYYYNLPIPSRFGYSFNGWFTAADGGSQITIEDVCRGDTTLYAHWTRIVLLQGSCGDEMTFILYGDGELDITGKGEMTSHPWTDEYAERVLIVNMEGEITSICVDAFEGCTWMESVEIPDSVTTIGGWAFANTRLESLILPKNLVSIGSRILDNVEGVRTLTVPKTVTDTGDWIGGSVIAGSYIEELIFEEGITKLPAGIASEDVRLTNVVIPDTVTTIEQNVFEGCTSLSAIDLPNSLTTIESGAFEGCSSLISINLPDSVTTIDDMAFAGTGLESLILPKNLVTIGSRILANVEGVRTLTIPKTISRIGGNVIADSYVEKLIFEEGITKLPAGIASEDVYLTDVVIPDTVTTIEVNAFEGCTALAAIDLPNSLTTIESGAFEGCSSLTSIDLPDTVTTIEYWAFANTSLTRITFEGAAPEIGEDCFYNVTATAYYPADNETWTEDVRQNYGGTITWVVVTEETPSNITSTSVDFNGKMHLITYIKLSDEIMADADAYISVTFNDVTKDHSVAELIRNLDSQGRVKVKQEMYAAMMRDEMTLQVFNGEGIAQPLTYKETTDVTDGFVFTALEYLKGRQAESTNPYMVELAKAAELYGIAVQVKFDYHTEQLTTEDIAKMEAAAADITIPATCDEEVTGTLPAGVTKQTKTVMFESDNTLRLYYYIDDAVIGNYTFTLDGETVTAAKKEAGKYYVQQENIASGLLSSRYTFTVSDGTDTYTVNTSALAYAYGRQENSSDQQMIDLSKLLYRYSQAADAYFG